jgi:hypothetical protein
MRFDARLTGTQLITAMVNACTNGPLFRRFQFKLIHILLHEIGGHCLITYIYYGRPITPENVIARNWQSEDQYDVAPGDEQAPVAGESGRYLEVVAFGGTMEFFNVPEVSGSCSKPRLAASYNLTFPIASNGLYR